MKIKKTEKVRELEERGHKDMLVRMYYGEDKSYTDILRALSQVEEDTYISEKKSGGEPQLKKYSITVLSRALYVWKIEELESYPELRETILCLNREYPHNYSDLSAWLERQGFKIDSRNSRYSRKYGERLKNIIDEWKIDYAETFRDFIMELHLTDHSVEKIDGEFIEKEIYIDRHILEKAVKRWDRFGKPRKRKRRKEAIEELFPGAGVKKIRNNSKRKL